MNSIRSRFLTALAYPRPVDDFLELVSPLWSARELRARVVRVHRETPDVTTLVLQPSRGFPAHRAGQHVALTLSIDGVRRTRVFSIASGEAPSDGTISVTVKARPGGSVTPHLVSRDLRGTVVALSRPAGTFVLPRELPARLLLLSGGSGITPVMSMLRTLDRQGHADRVTFVHWARSHADVIFAGELADLAQRRQGAPKVHVVTGPFAADDLRALVPDHVAQDTWACGPPPFLAAIGEAYAAQGASSKLAIERFSRGPEPGNATMAGEVTFARSRRRAAAVRGSLLHAAESAGVPAPSGCRMGICGTCVCRKLEGTTRDARTGELSSDADVDIKLCVSGAVGPVTIDL